MIRCVGVILAKSDGSVLAQNRDNNPNILNPDTWGIVSGGTKIGLDENLIAAAIRELLEETNYKVDLKDLRFLNKDVYTTDKGFEVERIVLWARYDGIQEISCNEGQEIRFVNPKEFNELNFAPGHENFLRKASVRVFYSGVELKR